MTIADRLKLPTTLDCILLLLLSFVVFGRVTGFEFQTNWDDNWYILYNNDIVSFTLENIRTVFSSFYGGYYAPLQMVSYMADYYLWGLRPGGFHLTNIVIHTVNGMLVYHLLRRWHGERLLALVASAVFLIHPVQVESVAWISQRKVLLALFFFLIAWERYCRYRDTPGRVGQGAYAASLIAFTLSLLCKPATVVLPVVLLMYDRCFAATERSPRYRDKIPFVVIAGFFSLLTLYTQLPEVAGGGRTSFHGGNPLATLYTMLPVFCRYLWMLVWPGGLSAEYAPLVRSVPDVTVLLSALLLTVVALTAIRLYRIDRRLSFWICFFWVALLPCSQIVPVISLMYDHYLYLPIIGAAALAGYGAVKLRDCFVRHNRAYLQVLLLLPLLLLSLASYGRCAVWRNALTLWTDAVQKEPASDKAWGLLGEAYLASGKYDLAMQAYQRGLGLNPSSTEALHGLGSLYTESGELEKGYTLLMRLVTLKPAYVTGWAALGTNYLMRGNYEDAEKAYQRAQKLQPEAMQVTALLGNLELQRGRLDQSRAYYLQAEANNWQQPESAYNLACIEALVGNTGESLAWIGKALQRGFADHETLYRDERLSSVRADPRFSEIMRNYPRQPDN